MSDNITGTVKPTLGVIPRFLWLEVRLETLQRAIKDKCEWSEQIPIEWINESNAIVSELKELRRKQ